MKSVLTIIPAYKGKNTIKNVIDEFYTSAKKLGLKPSGLIAVNGCDEETFKESLKLWRYKDLYVMFLEEPGKTNAIRKALESVYSSDVEPDIITFIDCDAQQKWSETFSKLVNKVDDTTIGHIQRRRPIKTDERKIEIEKFLNEVIYDTIKESEEVRRKEYYLSNLREESDELGPGRRIKDIQNNVCGTYNAIKKIYPEIRGKDFSFELEFTLLSITNDYNIEWEERNDYGRPTPFNSERYKKNFAEKLWVISEHLRVPLPKIKKIADGKEIDDELREKLIDPSFEMALNYE